MNRIELANHAALCVALLTFACLMGYTKTTNEILNDRAPPQNMIGKIVLHQTGRFAGVSRRTTIEKKTV